MNIFQNLPLNEHFTKKANGSKMTFYFFKITPYMNTSEKLKWYQTLFLISIDTVFP